MIRMWSILHLSHDDSPSAMAEAQLRPNWHLWARKSTVHVHRLLGWHKAVLCRNRLSNAKATLNPWGHHTRLQGSNQKYPYGYCRGVHGLFQGSRKTQTIQSIADYPQEFTTHPLKLPLPKGVQDTPLTHQGCQIRSETTGQTLN